MCGIVGVAGNLYQREETLMKRLLIFDWVRGPDATGLAAVREDGSVQIAKVADNPFILIDTQRFRNVLNANTSKAFIGHNRAQTRGANVNRNAHPFQVEHITGVHNGTLDYHCFEALKRELGQDFDVDSEAIFAAIAKWGLKGAIGRLTGSWSIVYYDAKDNTLNFIRNDERPMTYAYSKDLQRLYYASESILIKAAVELTGNAELYSGKDGVEYWQTEPNVHYKWDLDVLKKGSETIPKPKAKTIKGKETVNTGTNVSNFPRDRAITRQESGTQNASGGSGTGTKSTRTSRDSAPRYNGGRPGVHQCVGHPLSPFNDFMDRAEFDMLTYEGCSWCEEPVEYGQCGVVIFERDGKVLCPSCSGNRRRNRLVLADRARVPTVA